MCNFNSIYQYICNIETVHVWCLLCFLCCVFAECHWRRCAVCLWELCWPAAFGCGRMWPVDGFNTTRTGQQLQTLEVMWWARCEVVWTRGVFWCCLSVCGDVCRCVERGSVDCVVRWEGCVLGVREKWWSKANARLTAKKSGLACTKYLLSLFHVPNVIGVNLVNGSLEGQTLTAFLVSSERDKENQSLLYLYYLELYRIHYGLMVLNLSTFIWFTFSAVSSTPRSSVISYCR